MRLEDIGFYTLSDHRAKTAGPNSRMMRCEVLLNDSCNFKCPYCRGRKTGTLTKGEAFRLIRYWCDPIPLRAIRFSGGEPTLHPELVEIVEYARASGIEKIAISTNGSASRELYTRLLNAGVNDFSVSLDSANATLGDEMAGGIPGAWKKVIGNIRYLASEVYVTVGVVLTPENIPQFIETIKFADSLDVSDIRVISAAQWDKPLPELSNVPEDLLRRYPILAYRVTNFKDGLPIRGLRSGDADKCYLMMDDSVVAGDKHYPCVIYLREGGDSVGEVGPSMREDRMRWIRTHDPRKDPICKKNCLDVCVMYNRKVDKFRISKGEV